MPNKDQPAQELFDSDELAEYLRRNRQSIYWMRHVGTGPPAIRVGRRLLFRKADVDAWLDAQAEPASQAS